jgi:hypothetical protein
MEINKLAVIQYLIENQVHRQRFARGVGIDDENLNSILTGADIPGLEDDVIEKINKFVEEENAKPSKYGSHDTFADRLLDTARILEVQTYGRLAGCNWCRGLMYDENILECVTCGGVKDCKEALRKYPIRRGPVIGG